MADISKIKLENDTYDIKDATARTDISTLSTTLNNRIDNIDTTSPYNINLENLLFYDTNRTYYTQGCCVDNNNRLYIYEETNFPYGDLLILDISTLTYVSKISNLKLYHGNDMCFLNGKIYVASCKADDGTLTNTKIVIYDITNNTISEVNPFSNTQYTDLFEIATYDENNLICVLNKGTELFENLGIFLYNVTSGDITQITVTNTKNLQTNYWRAFQAGEYYNNKLYIMTSITNTIMELKIEGTTANLENIYNIPLIDNFGQTLGEIEGICKIPTDRYGEGTFILYSNVTEWSTDKRTLNVYLLNIENNTPLYLKENVLFANTYFSRREVTYVNNTSSSLYENGSSDFPFKSLMRAIFFCNNNKFNGLWGKHVYISGGDNYYIHSMTAKTFTIVNQKNSAVNIYTDNEGAVNHYQTCNMVLWGSSSAQINLINYNPIQLDGTQFIANYVNFSYIGSGTPLALIYEEGGANIVRCADCTGNGGNKCDYIIRTNNNSITFAGFTSVSNVVDTKYRFNGMSLNIVPATASASDYTRTGSVWPTVIKSGAILGF